MALARSIAIRFDQWRSRIWPSPPTEPRQRLGWLGEKEAAKFLRGLGYKVLYQRFRPRNRKGEIDLVCRHKDTLVFVEVKTRSSLAYGRPAEAVDEEKERLLIKGALAWLRMLHRHDIPVRFDIVEVLMEPGAPAHCTLIENAFLLPPQYVF